LGTSTGKYYGRQAATLKDSKQFYCVLLINVCMTSICGGHEK